MNIFENVYNNTNFTGLQQTASEYYGYVVNKTSELATQVTTSDLWNQTSEQLHTWKKSVDTSYIDQQVANVSTWILDNNSTTAPIAGLASGYLAGRAAVNTDGSIKGVVKSVIQAGMAYLIISNCCLESAGRNSFVTLSMITGAALALAQQKSSTNFVLKA